MFAAMDYAAQVKVVLKLMSEKKYLINYQMDYYEISCEIYQHGLS